MQQEQCPSCGQFWVTRPQAPSRWTFVAATLLLVVAALMATLFATAIIYGTTVSRRYGFRDLDLGRVAIETLVLGFFLVIAINLFAAARRRKRFAAVNATLRQCRTCGFQWTAS